MKYDLFENEISDDELGDLANKQGNDNDDQDNIAEQWEAMIENDDNNGIGSNVEGGRILLQEEINNVFGFIEQDQDYEAISNAKKQEQQKGIASILNTENISYDKLPMLDVVFDRFIRMFTSSLRYFTSDNVELSIESLYSCRFGEYLNSIPLPAILTVFKAQEWDNSGLVTVNANLIYSMVDILLGGKRGAKAIRVEGNPYTTIEQNLIEQFVQVLLSDLSGAFDPLTRVSFDFDRLETNPRFAAIAQSSNVVIITKVRIDMEGSGGLFDIVLPYATIEPVRELLLQMFMGEKFGKDAIWESHLANEIWHMKVDVEIIIDEFDVSILFLINNLNKGQVLPLNIKADSLIDVRCGDCLMFRGQVGRNGNNVAVKIKQIMK